jgi:hypothetical protein
MDESAVEDQSFETVDLSDTYDVDDGPVPQPAVQQQPQRSPPVNNMPGLGFLQRRPPPARQWVNYSGQFYDGDLVDDLFDAEFVDACHYKIDIAAENDKALRDRPDEYTLLGAVRRLRQQAITDALGDRDGLMNSARKIIRGLNKWCAMVGSLVYFKAWDNTAKMWHWKKMTKDEFKQAFKGYSIVWLDMTSYMTCRTFDENRTIEVSGQTYELNFRYMKKNDGSPNIKPLLVQIPIAKFWLENPGASRYDCAVFNPKPKGHSGACQESQLNLFCGFAFSRELVKDFTEWKHIVLVLMHIRYTWCDTDAQFIQVLYRFGMALQEPHVKQGVGIGIGGPQGSGKTCIMNFIAQIIGSFHAITLHKPEDAVGAFTGPIADKVFLFFDEMSLENAKKEDVATLKNLLTGLYYRLNQKHINQEYVESFHNIMAASNEIASMVLAGPDERRWELYHSTHTHYLKTPAVTKVIWGTSAARKADTAFKTYFNALNDSMYNDDCRGLKTFANFLYHIDFPKWEFRRNLVTPLLFVNKQTHLSNIWQWWLECVVNRECDVMGRWNLDQDEESWYNAYVSWFRGKLGQVVEIDETTGKVKNLKGRLPGQAVRDQKFWSKWTEVLPACASQYVFKAGPQKDVLMRRLLDKGNWKSWCWQTHSTECSDVDQCAWLSCKQALLEKLPGADAFFEARDDNPKEFNLERNKCDRARHLTIADFSLPPVPVEGKERVLRLLESDQWTSQGADGQQFQDWFAERAFPCYEVPVDSQNAFRYAGGSDLSKNFLEKHLVCLKKYQVSGLDENGEEVVGTRELNIDDTLELYNKSIPDRDKPETRSDSRVLLHSIFGKISATRKHVMRIQRRERQGRVKTKIADTMSPEQFAGLFDFQQHDSESPNKRQRTQDPVLSVALGPPCEICGEQVARAATKSGNNTFYCSFNCKRNHEILLAARNSQSSQPV